MEDDKKVTLVLEDFLDLNDKLQKWVGVLHADQAAARPRHENAEDAALVQDIQKGLEGKPIMNGRTASCTSRSIRWPNRTAARKTIG